MLTVGSIEEWREKKKLALVDGEGEWKTLKPGGRRSIKRGWMRVIAGGCWEADGLRQVLEVGIQDLFLDWTGG